MKFIYHQNCFDGFCSAWIGYQVWPTAEFIPDNYDREEPEVTGSDVIVADFSYKRHILLKMKEKAKSLIVLDHHKTAKEDLEGLDFCTFDMTKSGARLVWEYCINNDLISKNTPISWLIDYTEDRDLWTKKLPFTNEINAAIRSYPLNFQLWDIFSERLPTEFIQEGIHILRYQDNIIKQHMQHLEIVEIDGIVGKGCACSIGSLWSDIMGRICENENVPFAIVWCDTIDGYRIYSIRSRNKNLDVSNIAKKYGGGGHESAAGFRCKISTSVLNENAPSHRKIIVN